MLSQIPLAAFGRLDNLAQLTPGRTKAANALWGENPLSMRLVSSRRVVVAEIGEKPSGRGASVKLKVVKFEPCVGSGRPGELEVQSSQLAERE
jgi:hypothetical protein